MAIYDKEHIQQGIVEYLDTLWNNQEDRIEDAFELLKNLTEVEIIENSNGIAIKFPTGLLIILGSANVNLGQWTFAAGTWNFPENFAHPPAVSYARYDGSVDSKDEMAALGSLVLSVENHRVRFGVGVALSSSKTFGLSLMAIGRWK